MSRIVPSIVQLAAALVLAPLLPAIVNRVKAVAAGRRGPPLLQGYLDLAKLLGKGAVYSRTTGFAFRAGPVAGLAAVVCAACIIPWAGQPGLVTFDGDLVLFAYLFGLMRFLTIAAAMDTGSSFEGMGASREATFSALAEPALLVGLAALARRAGSISLSTLLPGQGIGTGSGAALLLVAGASFIVLLAECSRIPVDDPATHLELTMIHEVMVLDHGGVDLAFIEYGAAVKLWCVAGLPVAMLLPRTGGPWAADLGAALAGMAAAAAVVGVVESIMARLRLSRVPQLLVAALTMSCVALALVFVRN
jgi:formate hydrogenlyase subunit 4